jgi:hypothetical protein
LSQHDGAESSINGHHGGITVARGNRRWCGVKPFRKESVQDGIGRLSVVFPAFGLADDQFVNVSANIARRCQDRVDAAWQIKGPITGGISGFASGGSTFRP